MSSKKQMLSAVYAGPYKVEQRWEDIPEPGKGELLLKIKYAGICGSDMLIYYGKHPRGREGIIMCHEFVGEVVELGANCSGKFKIGDRVAVEPLIACGSCQPCLSRNYNVCETLGLYGIDKHGGLAEYIAVPEKNLHLIPERVTFEQAALLEPLAVACHVVDRSRVRLGSNVLVLGGGPIGYLIALVCKTAGVSYVGVSEVDPYRLRKLKEAGIEVINAREEDLQEAVLEKTKGNGVDIVFEAAGVTQTLRQATTITNIRGQIVIVALVSEPVPFDLTAVNFKEYDVIGSRTYTDKDYVTALKLLEQGKASVELLITHTLPLAEASRGFEIVAAGKEVMKVLIRP
ncbi:MAG: zinc-dependent alcohol dehydrogenase [Dethiobacteria bacterium]|jgi:(R,R)-butanediol dehydrogenase/meso-butanediol dehydrogenase/diacetyl reductase|nr:alcohol dehydrogenase catalytic domain-containing protein [Bacillota bacterium]